MSTTESATRPEDEGRERSLELARSTDLAIDRPGLAALAAMSDEEFETRLGRLKLGASRIRRIKQELMAEGVDYGIIPGTKKPTLLKPGGEKLCEIFSLRATFDPVTTFGDGVHAPPLRVVTKCTLHLGTLDGPAIAVGYGAANSWERRYRYRQAERACPACGIIGSLLQSRKEEEPGFFCWKKKGGCGARFAPTAPEIVSQEVGQIDNPDPHDLENTLVKMAEKRAHVDATLRGTSSSDLFTQDVEDGAPVERAEAAESTAAAPAGDAPAGETTWTASKFYAALKKEFGDIWKSAESRGVMMIVFGTSVAAKLGAIPSAEFSARLNHPTTGWAAALRKVRSKGEPAAVADRERQPGEEPGPNDLPY